MKSERLSERASRTEKEAKALQEIIDRFGPEFEKRTLGAVRQSVVDEVERAFQGVMLEVKEKEKEIASYPTLNQDTEVWVFAAYAGSARGYHPSAIIMKMKFAQLVAAEQREEQILMPTKAFEKTVQELKNSILEGGLDERLHLTGEHLIHDRMREASPV